MPVKKTKPIYIGPVVGYNRSIHSVTFKSFEEDLCPSFENGTANGFYAGLSAEFMLGKLVNSDQSIIVRALYNTLPASFETAGYTYPSLVEDPEKPDRYVKVNSSTRHSTEVTYSMLTGEIMYKLNLFGSNFGITVGPTFDFPLTKELEQVFELVEPDNVKFKVSQEGLDKGYRYADNDRKIYVQEGEIPDASGFRLGIKAGVQYEILLQRMYIVPAIYYNYGVTKLSPDKDNWFVHALQVGVDVRFSI